MPVPINNDRPPFLNESTAVNNKQESQELPSQTSVSKGRKYTSNPITRFFNKFFNKIGNFFKSLFGLNSKKDSSTANNKDLDRARFSDSQSSDDNNEKISQATSSFIKPKVREGNFPQISSHRQKPDLEQKSEQNPIKENPLSDTYSSVFVEKESMREEEPILDEPPAPPQEEFIEEEEPILGAPPAPPEEQFVLSPPPPPPPPPKPLENFATNRTFGDEIKNAKLKDANERNLDARPMDLEAKMKSELEAKVANPNLKTPQSRPESKVFQQAKAKQEEVKPLSERLQEDYRSKMKTLENQAKARLENFDRLEEELKQKQAEVLKGTYEQKEAELSQKPLPQRSRTPVDNLQNKPSPSKPSVTASSPEQERLNREQELAKIAEERQQEQKNRIEEPKANKENLSFAQEIESRPKLKSAKDRQIAPPPARERTVLDDITQRANRNAQTNEQISEIEKRREKQLEELRASMAEEARIKKETENQKNTTTNSDDTTPPVQNI